MVNAYKRWTDTELVENGKRIRELIKLAWAEMRANGKVYQPKYLSQIEKSEYTLQQLRIEWKRRNK